MRHPRTPTPPTRRTLGWMPTVVVLGAVLVAGALASAWLRGDTARDGVQVPSPLLRIGAAATGDWEVMASSGEPRDGFPQPLMRTADDICFGFSRVDFDRAEPAPSLARCIDRPQLPADGFVLVAVVASGLESWHVIAFGTEVDAVYLELADGTRLDPGRVHLADSAVALRLPIEHTPAELRWSSPTVTYRCRPEVDAAPGEWCEAPGGT